MRQRPKLRNKKQTGRGNGAVDMFGCTYGLLGCRLWKVRFRAGVRGVKRWTELKRSRVIRMSRERLVVAMFLARGECVDRV